MLIRRGELAKQLRLSWPTVKYYTELGLLVPAKRTPHGQFLYNIEECQERFTVIQSLKMKRFTLSEIKDRLLIEKIVQGT
ncbi:MAG: MerR family transcriptional regulator [Chlamydiota bacterium]|nr:MerR family transcriptional regulator [Chlamydiota bacterium]